MTTSAVVFSTARDDAAGRELGHAIHAKLGKPDAVILFASPTNDIAKLVAALREACSPRTLVGCSSAGEFATGSRGEGASSAVALSSKDIRFTSAIARNVHDDFDGASTRLVSAFQDEGGESGMHRAALILTDALAGFADELVTDLTRKTAGAYQFFGGGAGDDAAFTKTHVICGSEIATDAVVALEMISKKPLGVGVRHGWEPAGPVLRVTDAQGPRLVSLNAAPAVEAFTAHAESTGQKFDAKEPLAFFLHNVLGIVTPAGHKLRVPLGVNPDGSIACAAEIPIGASVRIMRATSGSSAEAASSATRDAIEQLEGNEPEVALFFDCVATRLRMGNEFDLELDALQNALGDASFAGFNTYGQVARSEGQFSGFHNCTAVVCVIPK